MREVLRRHGWQIALLSVGVLVLVALILNLAQGGLWVVSGASGKNAYELAVENGFEGSLQEWLSSLAGADGQDGTNGADGGDGQNGKSAYELAVENGFRGSLQEWLLSLAFGEDGEDGKDGIDGENGKDGADGQDGADGVGIRSVYINGQGHLMVVLTDGSVIDAGAVGSLPQSEPSDFELAQQQGYTGTLHEWLCSYNDGSRETSVSDITKSSEGRLIVTLSDGSELDAGPAPADGFISQAVDAEGFRPRFEMVVMNHEASSLYLREKPNDTGSASVTIVNAGDELVCIGSAELEGELFYRFYHAGSGRNCYARAKYFDLKYDYRTAEAGLNLPDRLVLTAGEPFRFVTGEIMPWADDSYRLEYTYSGTSHLLETEDGAHEFTIFAVACVDKLDSWYSFIDAESEDAFNEAVQRIIQNAYYTNGDAPVYGDRLLTLSTCYGSTRSSRLIIIAKEEKANVWKTEIADAGTDGGNSDEGLLRYDFTRLREILIRPLCCWRQLPFCVGYPRISPLH